MAQAFGSFAGKRRRGKEMKMKKKKKKNTRKFRHLKIPRVDKHSSLISTTNIQNELNSDFD